MWMSLKVGFAQQLKRQGHKNRTPQLRFAVFLCIRDEMLLRNRSGKCARSVTANVIRIVIEGDMKRGTKTESSDRNFLQPTYM